MNRSRQLNWWTPLAATCLLAAPLYAQEAQTPKAEPKAAAPAVPETRPAEPAAPRTLPIKSQPREITFSFHDAEWEEVLRWFAELTGRSLHLEATPKGKFNYFDTRKYTVPEAIDVLNSVLLPKGFAILTRDNFLVVADLSNGIPPNLVERIDIKDLPSRGRTELVKVLLSLRGLVAEDAKKEFESMKGRHGTMIALPSTNQLMIVDTAKNVQQIVDLIMDLEGNDGKADLKAYPLKHVSALEAERVVRDLLGMGARETPGTPAGQPQNQQSRGGSSRDDMRSRFFRGMMEGGGMPGGPPPGMPGGPQPPQPGATPPAPQATKGPFVSVDTRTNTLFVTATPDKLALVTQVVTQIDIPQDDGNSAISQAPKMEVYQVASGTAEGLAQVMATMFVRSPEIRVSAHPDGRALIVVATPSEHVRIAEVLDQLKTDGLKVEVIPLRSLDAASTATLVRALLGQKEDEDTNSRSRFSFFFSRRDDDEEKEIPGPAIEADTERNRLLIRGTEPQIAEVRDLLSKLGETGVGTGIGLERGRFRVVPLGERDPREMAETIQRIWTRLEAKNPIRIEVLDDDSAPKTDNPAPRSNNAAPKSGSAAPKADSARPKAAPKQDRASPDGSAFNHFRNQGASDIVLVSDPPPPVPARELAPKFKPIPPAAAEPGKQAPPMQDEKKSSPITIVIGPENLTIASEDTEALDLLDNLINSVVRGKSSMASNMGIYYLKASDAQELAYMLDEALYGERNFFTDDSSPNRARILPDTRTNSLLVVGPAAEQRKIQQLIEVLDTEDPPESALAAPPRTIPVKHGRATEIAKVVRDVFAMQLFTPSGQNQQDQRQGGGSFFFSSGSSSRNSQKGKEKLTVGVDEQTNTIVVSCPLAIFEDVQALVESLDEAARENGRTAKVVTLKNAKPEAVEKALSSLLGARSSAKQKQDAAAKAGAEGQQGGPQMPGFEGFNRDRGRDRGDRGRDRGRSRDRD